MGQNQILTKEQQIILDEVAKTDYLKSSFYFTGGTALSAVYLNHRYSEDIDLFSEIRFDNQTTLALVTEWGKRHGFTFDARSTEVVQIFNLTFNTSGIKTKVDFAYHPYKRLQERKTFNNIPVDSLLDIATNKLLTISQRTDVKDFVDLYFLLKEFTIWDLITGVRAKFGMKTDPFLVATDFSKIQDFDYLPRMIKPLDLATLKQYFIDEAQRLGKDATG